MSILDMSISGGAIILAVLLVRMFAKGRTSRKLFLILWGVAVIRLILPFSLPFEYSIRSLMPKEKIVLPAVDVTLTENISSVQFVLNGGTEKHNENQDIHVSLSESGTIVPQESNTPIDGKEINILTVVYFTVGGIMLCGFAVYGIVTCRKFTKNSFEVTENEFGAHDIRVSLSEDVTTPLTYGIFRPVILLPENTNLKDTETLKYVLMHEETHIKHFDGIKKLILVLTLCVHWFNPLVWVMLFAANRDMELACDESVIKKMGGSSRRSYALALLNMEEGRRHYSVFTSAFGKNAVEERVKTIVSGKKHSVAAILASLMIVGTVFTVFATSAVAKDDGKDTRITAESESDTSFEISETSEETSEKIINSILQWPSELLPENFPVPSYTEIYSVEQDDNSVRVILFGKKSSLTSYPVTFMKKLLIQGFVRNSDPDTGLVSYINKDGLKVTVCESDSLTGEHIKEIGELSPAGYAFEITVEQSEPLEDYRYWVFPLEDTDLGLEEIVFDKWPTEYLPDNFPKPDESIFIRRIEQKKNGLFITMTGNINDTFAYFSEIRENMYYDGEFLLRNANGDYAYYTTVTAWLTENNEVFETVTYQICPPNEYIKK